jgi:hypothetical protein
MIQLKLMMIALLGIYPSLSIPSRSSNKDTIIIDDFELFNCKDVHDQQALIFKNVSLFSENAFEKDYHCKFRDYNDVSLCAEEFKFEGNLVDVVILGDKISVVSLVQQSEIDLIIKGFE